MEQVVDILSWACLVAGGVLALIGAIGIIRLPDVFARMHGAGMIDTMGLGLIFLGLALQAGLTTVTMKLILIFVFVLFTSPTTTYALARAAIYGGEEPIQAGDLTKAIRTDDTAGDESSNK